MSGREIELDTAKEFIFSMGGVAGLGYGLRLLAQQGAKFINGIWPGTGSAVSSVIAGAGTNGIGNAAIAYYIDGQGIEIAKQKLNEANTQSHR